MNGVYVLILTIVGTTTQSGPAVVTHEFSSRQACEQAGQAWYRTNLPLVTYNGNWSQAKISWMCTPR
jgi:hypothetical protein